MTSHEPKTTENTSKAAAHQVAGEHCISSFSPGHKFTIRPKLVNQQTDVYKQQVNIQRKEQNGEPEKTNKDRESYVGDLSGSGQALPHDINSFYRPQSDSAKTVLAHEHTHIPIQNSMIQRQVIQRVSWEGAESEALCITHTDEGVYEFIRDHYFSDQPNARSHIIHYRTGGGSDYPEHVANLFSANPRIRSRIASLISDQMHNGATTNGVLIGRGADDGQEPPIRQRDYDSADWRNSNGNIDEVDWKLIGPLSPDGYNQFAISIRDPYTWHPLEDRPTQCIHEAMEDLKSDGAADYTTTGTENVSLLLPPLQEPSDPPIQPEY